ncbi:MAG: PAS domain-containing protein, partial [Planctomycetota bacterium]
MRDPQSDRTAPAQRRILEQDAILRLLVRATARDTGADFFRALVHNLAEVLGTFGAWITEYDPATRRLRALAFHMNGEFIEWEAAIDGTPCAVVIDGARLVHLPDRLLELYPNDPDLRKANAVSYMGVPLQDPSGTVVGHFAILDTRPMPEDPRIVAVLQLFAERAAAELLRLRAEREVREREERLAGLVGGAMDAIVELDDELRLTLANPAAERTFDRPAARLIGSSLRELLVPESAERVIALARDLA